jgi:transcriptional regulator with XRE-family HTH domain
MAGEIDTDILGRLVRRRIAQSANLREAAQDAGVSAATLSRVQRGHSPDADALVALSRWLQVPIERVLRHPPIASTDGVSTLEKVEVHLRADPRLSPETADRLVQVFRAVYEEFTDSAERGAGPERR